MGKPNKLRPLAVAVIRREDAIFVGEYESDKPQYAHFYRPTGGKIEFQESGAETAKREFMEEVQLEITITGYLDTLESIFTYRNKPHHELVRVYTADFLDDACYAADFTVHGTDGKRILFLAKWMPLQVFRDGQVPLFPDGLLDLLDSVP